MAYATSNGYAPSGGEHGSWGPALGSDGYGSGLLSAPVAAAPSGIHRAATESCWMCGIRLPIGQLVPDGANACEDVRWYCQDTAACTERWTSRTALQTSRTLD
jgi:hypothetical protein